MKKTPKILVVGSFVMDQIMTTTVFPREGQTVIGKAFHKAPGGKGVNQAVQMARLGAEVTMVGCLGSDGNGREFLETCRAANVDMTHVRMDANAPTGCAVIILHEQPDGSTQNRIIINAGSNMAITPEDVAFLKDGIAKFDMVVLQLEIPMEINRLVARYASEKHVPVLLNPAPSASLPRDLLPCLSYLAPNETEAEDLTGIPIAHESSETDLSAARQAAETLQKAGCENVLVTLGAAGAMLFTRERAIHAPCAENVTAVDPTAAGDSFIGAFAFALCSGVSQEDALLFANHTAAITVSALGAIPSLPTLSQVAAGMTARGVHLSDESLLK